MMNNVYHQYKGKGLGMAAVGVGEHRQAATRYVKRYSIAFPVLLDSNKVIASRIKLQHEPASLLVDSTGKVLRFGGYPGIYYLERWPWRIKRLLKKDE